MRPAGGPPASLRTVTSLRLRPPRNPIGVAANLKPASAAGAATGGPARARGPANLNPKPECSGPGPASPTPADSIELTLNAGHAGPGPAGGPTVRGRGLRGASGLDGADLECRARPGPAGGPTP